MNNLLLKSMGIIFCLVLLFIVFSMEGNEKPIGVIDLIDSLGKYEGKTVRVEGYVSMGFEQCVLWPEDPEKSRIQLEYWVWFRELGKGCGAGEYAKNSKHGRAIIEGTFNENDKGHLGMYSASINNAEIIWLNDEGDKENQ